MYQCAEGHETVCSGAVFFVSEIPGGSVGKYYPADDEDLAEIVERLELGECPVCDGWNLVS
jgi:hypothetical protein